MYALVEEKDVVVATVGSFSTFGWAWLLGFCCSFFDWKVSVFNSFLDCINQVVTKTRGDRCRGLVTRIRFIR